MRLFYLKFISVVILSFILISPSVAQRSNGITVEGKISVQQGSVDGAVIQMYLDGKRLDDYGVGSDGNYKVELTYNHKYELIFVRKDNFPQKIVVESAVPKNILASDPKFPPFPLNVNLFTEIPGIDKSFSENTVLKIYYSPNVDNFISEIYYNDAQIAKLIEQAKLQSQMLDKESDYLSKLTRAEQAELRREYNQLLEDAGKDYSNEKFLAALDGYKAASQIFPKEQFPKDRIAEINDLLGLMMAAAELDKAKLDRFNALIVEADQQFGQKQYQLARNSYNRALSIKPTDPHATEQLKTIGDILRKQLQDEQYNDLIAQGDNSMNQLLYDDAINRFSEALKIKPNEAYPKSKLEEINGIIAKQAKDVEKQASYKEAMLQGNTMFEKQFYDKALSSYENALKFVPGDEAATNKIADVRRIMKETADKMRFDELVKSADKSYKKKAYQEALADYSEAATILPDDAYVNKQIDEINQILQLVESFADLVFKADNQFINENYDASKSLYQKALEIKNDDKHSQDRIKEIDGILANKNLDSKYDDLIAQADNRFNGKDYQNAKNSYNEALTVKPREKYPRDKINEIDGILQQLAKTDQDYQQAIAKADGLFQQKNYENARREYANAGNIKPQESYPPEMITKIDGLIAEQKRLAEEAAAAEAARLAALQAEKDKNYSDAIAKGDNLFNQKDYENSRTAYRNALTIKPGETYPQQRIDEIGTLLAQLSAAQKAYEDAITRGDREFNREGFDAAKTAYNDAKTAKPDETYPDEQLAKIDSIVTTRARLAEEAAAAEAARLAAFQAEKDKNYSDAIAKGDNLFNQKDYENSRTAYRDALTIKPGETYPQQRIDEIGTLLAQLSAAQKAYEDAITRGDREFNREGFDAAKTAYNDAKTAKPDETYPDEQLAKIDSIVTTRARLAEEAAAAEAARLAALQAEKDKNYSDAIAKGDNLFNQKDYENSRTAYRDALTIKPGETYPQQKIDEIGTLLAQLSAAQKAYEDAITRGDREFNREGFDAAKTAYNDAKTAKPDETYPDEQLAKIDSIVTTRARLAEEAAAAEAARLAALQAEKDKNYSDAIAKGDNLFNQKDYENSRTAYRDALTIKPGETYPQQRIDEIGTLLAQLSAAQKAYEDAITRGDREFNREGFDAAKTAYNDAKTAKPDETYPDEQLAKIDSIVTTRARLAEEAAAAEAARLAALQAEKDKNYSDAIAKGDNLFNQKDYENSRTEYRNALTIKPGETYPQQRIDEIGTLLAQLSAAQKAYEDAITRGDREFNREGFDAAKTAYNDAKSAKPDETYPDESWQKSILS